MIVNFFRRLSVAFPIVLSAAIMLITAAQATPVVVADYRDDYVAPTPATGWSYLWNEFGNVGNEANYSEVFFNSSQNWYTPGGLTSPNNTPGNFLLLSSYYAHPGPGVRNSRSLGIERYAIAGFTVAQAGLYSLTDSFAMRLDTLRGNGTRILVNVNSDAFLVSKLVGSGGPTDLTPVSFNTSLGYLHAGDRVYVSLGANGDSDADATQLDFSIALEVMEPTSLSTLGFGLLGLSVGLARRRRRVSK